MSCAHPLWCRYLAATAAALMLWACQNGASASLYIPHPDDPARHVEYFAEKPAGAGPWPTVVFLHGHRSWWSRRGGEDYVDWGVLKQFAARGYLAVAVSQPGYGDSSGPADFSGPFTQHAVAGVIAKLRADGEASDNTLKSFAAQNIGTSAATGRTIMRHMLTVLSVVWLAACANTPEKVVLNPEVKGTSTGIGAGQNVKLIVTGAAVDAPLIEGQSRFPLAQPATETVKSKMREGLLRHGFNVDDFGATDRQLTVNVAKMNNVVTSGALRDTIQVDVSLELTATTGAGTLTRTINNSQVREVNGDASRDEVGAELNESSGQALARALNDVELLQFLGK